MSRATRLHEEVLQLLRDVNIGQLLVMSWLLRVVLVVYGEWQDTYLTVKYTDIDYHVFSDAAAHVANGGSPYTRPTYRYTPLLAWILLPNHFLFESFGKVVFITIDVAAGWVMYHILSLQPLSDRTKMAFCALWLLNPLTAAVSSRGNAESIMALLVLLTMYCLMRGRVTVAAVSFGLSVHFKIYPAVYAPALILAIANVGDQWRCSVNSLHWVVRRCLAPPSIKFAAISFITFIFVTIICFLLYGWVFIHEAYVYHLTRQDTKHNFSPYFLLLYLTRGHTLGGQVSLAAFVPQIFLLLMSSLYLHKDIPFCCFIQTYVFVTFNKVCTSQYFLWYLCLLPVAAPAIRISLREAVLMTFLWFIGQGLWLLPAYLLEFHGINTFLLIWLASLVFFIINIGIIITLVKRHVYTQTLDIDQMCKSD